MCGAISRLGEGKPLSGRSALTGAASGSRSWSSSAREGAARSLFRKRGAVSAGGRSLYEIGRDSGSRLVFWDSPPGPAFRSARGGSREGGCLRAVARFFGTTFSGGGFSDDEPAVLRNAG